MIIPPAGDMTSLLDSIDGLIVSGGPDISPANLQRGARSDDYRILPRAGLFRDGANREGS